MKIAVGRLRMLIRETVGVGNDPKASELRWTEVVKRFPWAASDFNKYWREEGFVPDKDFKVGRFYLDDPSVALGLAMYPEDRWEARPGRILSYLDDSVALVYRGPKLGWDSVD